MHGLRRGRLPPELHLLHLAHRQVGARGVPRARSSHESDHTACGRTSSSTLRTSSMPTCSTAARAAFKVRPTLAAHRRPELGRLRRLRAVRARSRRPGQRGVPRLREVPDPGPRRDGADRRGPHARAVPHAAQRASAARHPALQLLRNTVSTAATTTTILVFAQVDALTDGHSDAVIIVVNLDPHVTRETTSTCPRSACSGATSSSVHDELTGPTWNWSQHTSSGSTPSHEPAHILTVRAPSARRRPP